MELYSAVDAFSSLAQETRLKVFKVLIEYGEDGVSPKQIAKRLEVPDNTLSFHLANLQKAGLVSSQKDGRSLIYSANCGAIEALIDYLKENCCILSGSKSCAPKKRGK